MKSNFDLLIAFVLVFAGGMVAMRVWMIYRAPATPVPVQEEVAASPAWLTAGAEINLERATTPEDVVEVGQPGEPQRATASQLATIHIPELESVVSRSGDAFTPPQEPSQPAGVELGDARYNTSPAAQPAQEITAIAQAPVEDAPQEPSKISLIEAPVTPLLIQDAEAYKAFKQRARGSYPAADFAVQNVLVLESASNLPDKVFEIQSVQEQDGKLQVTYRVSVFGLDQKTNTHSAVLVKKSNLPVELKQVL